MKEARLKSDEQATERNFVQVFPQNGINHRSICNLVQKKFDCLAGIRIGQSFMIPRGVRSHRKPFETVHAEFKDSRLGA